ncbi:MAG: acyltransferase, partial [Ralstonia sp.]|nr:acyltransferase [Ralstonia sp.]
AGRVMVHIRELPIPPDFCTHDYSTDSAFRSDFHRWLTELWEEKDQQIENMLAQAANRVA